MMHGQKNFNHNDVFYLIILITITNHNDWLYIDYQLDALIIIYS